MMNNFGDSYKGQGEGSLVSNSELNTQPSELPSVPPHCSLCLRGEHLSPENLQKNSESYTQLRAEEYWQYRRAEDAWYEQQAKRPGRVTPRPEYLTQYQQCPCGSDLPCPHHEEFHPHFWTCSPHDPFYAQSLQLRGIPYRDPTEFLG